jgi:branched-chain amino acid transport system permease protein
VTAIASPVPTTRRLSRTLTLLVAGIVGIVLYYAILAAVSDPTTALSQVFNALTLGAIYALVALGYTMVYGIIELINFAHGDVFMMGAFVSLWTLSHWPLPAPLDHIGLGLSGQVTDPLQLGLYLLIAFVVTMPIIGLLNVAIERFFYRPLRNAPRLAPLITAIGVSFILQNVALVVAGSGDRKSPQIFTFDWRIPIGEASIPLLNVVIVLIAVTLMIVLQLFIRRTRLGRAMRSTAQDREAAQLMGVDLNQTIAITFLLGGALAAAAGVVWGLYFGFVRQDLGFNAGLKAFTSAVLGGIGNITGAALGGFLIGFIEVLAATLGYLRWTEFIVFLVLTLILVFRPAGILGQQLGERA